jgi:hypothetical protein
MRKPILILLSILIFCLFAILGFLSVPAENEKDLIKSNASDAVPTAYQQNLLILQVDRLDTAPPHLQAVWLAGIFKSANQTILTFSQPYPPDKEGFAFKELRNAFALDSSGKPTSLFLNQLKTRGVNWQSYIIIDAEGIQFADRWLRAQGAPIFAPAPAAVNILLEATCHLINGGYSGTPAPSQNTPWAAFVTHLKSDLSTEQIQSTWNQLFAANPQPTRCEIITN